MPLPFPSESPRALLARFLTDTSGAVVTDWVVLTAAIAGIGVAVVTITNVGVERSSSNIQKCLEIQGDKWGGANGGDYGQRLESIQNECGAL